MFDELLSSLGLDKLKPRLALLDVPKRPTRKADIIALLRSELLSPRLRDYWEKLDPLDQKAVAEAVHSWNGQFHSLRFASKYSSVPETFGTRHPGRGSRSAPEARPLALFFYNGVVPDELCARLKAFVPKPDPDVLATLTDEELPEADPPPGAAHPEDPATSPYRIRRAMMETVVRHELPALLHLVDSGQLAVSDKTGLPSAASLRRIDAILVGGDFYSGEDESALERWDPGPLRPIRSYAWPLLLQTGGLAKRNGRRLDLTRKGKTALGAPFADTVKAMYLRWRDKGMLDELRRIEVIKGQTAKGRHMAAAAPRRAVIEDALKCCPVAAWVGVDELFRYMKSEGYHFDVTYDEWKLYVADSNYGALGYQGFASFEVLQGRYLLAYLFEYLATLGLVDLAYVLPYGMRDDFRQIWGTDDLSLFSRYDGLRYFRLNALGAWCLDLTDTYRLEEFPAAPLLTVDDELQLHLERPPEPADILILDRYAVRTSDMAWRITPASMLDAIEQGQSPKAFRGFLESRSARPPGATFDDFFAEIENRRLALREGGPARLLHCADPALVRLLTSDPATRNHCLQAGPTLLVVPEKSEKALRRGLRRLGYILPTGGRE
jgi:hypothetical protein